MQRERYLNVTCLKDIDTGHGSININPNSGVVSARSHLIYGKLYLYQTELVGQQYVNGTKTYCEKRGKSWNELFLQKRQTKSNG